MNFIWRATKQKHNSRNGSSRITPSAATTAVEGSKQVIENSFDWPGHYQMLEKADSSRGILPLVWQSSRLSGFLTTSPFPNCSGVVAETKATKHALTVSSGEPAALAKARIQILQDQERQGSLAPGGIDWVREKFDVGGTAADVLQLHSALCGIT